MMRLVEIDATTEDTFFRCLHDEVPADPRVMAMRRAWRARYEPLGHRGKVLFDDEERVVGLTNYIPIEHSPYEGDNLMAILCMWIHGYEHLVGNQQGQGYGRFMLEAIEADARASGCDGVCVWAKDYDAWNPISFYEHMGYERADVQGLDVLAWKPFSPQARPPRLLPRRVPPRDAGDGRVRVTSVSNGWCGGGCQQCMLARDALTGLEQEATLVEVYAHSKADMRARGESIDVLYLDDEPFRPDGPPAGVEDLRQAVLARHAGKR